MSAFILSDKHIFSIAVLLQIPAHVQDMANMLKRINIKSVNYRYSHHNEPTRVTKCKPYKLEDYYAISQADLYKMVHCWIYQSCEDDSNLEFHIMRDWLTFKLDSLGITAEHGEQSTIWAI